MFFLSGLFGLVEFQAYFESSRFTASFRVQTTHSLVMSSACTTHGDHSFPIQHIYSLPDTPFTISFACMVENNYFLYNTRFGWENGCRIFNFCRLSFETPYIGQTTLILYFILIYLLHIVRIKSVFIAPYEKYSYKEEMPMAKTNILTVFLL